jgi:hypothetical protein
MTDRKPRQHLSRSAKEATEYGFITPDKVRGTITKTFVVAEDSAQADLVHALEDTLIALQERSWRSRERLVHLARLSLVIADKEEEKHR